MFRVGSLVALKSKTREKSGAIGMVERVISSDIGLHDFALYDVYFAFGRRTLHGSELGPISDSVFSGCVEKERLLIHQKKAMDAYVRKASELADAVGLMAHTEFEFLKSTVEATRQFLAETNNRLEAHTAKHGC
jgi:hypothetical protein